MALGKIDSTKPMYVFINGRFEPLEPVILSLSGGTPKIYLNWVLYRVTLDEVGTINDPTLIDDATLEPVAEMGQLEFAVQSTDTSATALDTTSQFAKNTSPIVVFEFERNSDNELVLLDTYERVKQPALARADNAGLIRVTHGTGVAVSPTDPVYLKLPV